MTLIHCKSCNSEISKDAMTCPKCGAQQRKPKRSIFGKLIKWTFILFNVLMLWWLIASLGGAADLIDSTQDEAEQAGAALGTGIGMLFILFVWGMGDLILGLGVLLTRGK